MANRFFIKRNDTSPALIVQLRDESGSPIEQLQSSDDVRFHMSDEDGNVVIDAAGAVEDASNAEVRYSWDSTDTDTSGTYDAEFEVTFDASGKTETFPNSANILVVIEDDLA